MVHEFLQNFEHNLFKPLLLFFYFGFLIPIFKVQFEFPYVIYQGLTMYLLVAIGWHGGEELAEIKASSIGQIVGFMVVGLRAELRDRGAGLSAAGRLTKLRKSTGPRWPGTTGRTRRGRSPPAWGCWPGVGRGFRRLHAGHAGRHGDPRVLGGAVSGGAAAPSGHGRDREHAR